MSYSIKHLTTGGIITNYKCSVACAHCRHKASPDREDGFISPAMLKKTLNKLEELGCKSVHLEGGEPFLYPEELLDAVKIINKSNIFLEHILTNCSWYKNAKDTKVLLKQLQNNGLRRLVLKVSPFQNEHIPLKKVQNVAKVAETLGINILIWDNEVYPEVASFDITKTHSIKQYLKKYGDDYMKKLASRFKIVFAGRSFDAYNNHLNKYPVSELLTLNSAGCYKDFPTAIHFHTDMYGNFIFSHTNGVAISIDDLGKELDPKKYPYLTILLNGGVNSMYKLATDKYGFTPKKDGYISKCHLCYEIRRHLVTKENINSPDLYPVSFYLSK